MTARADKLGKLVKQRGLQVTGFRNALRDLVKEFCDDDSEGWLFEEWFGDCQIVPAAFAIERDEREGIWGVTVHVYEVEVSARLPAAKLKQYGRIADGEGPLICLHIIDRYGSEDLLGNEALECFAFWPPQEIQTMVASIRRDNRAARTIPDKPTVRKWKAAYDAVTEMGVKI